MPIQYVLDPYVDAALSSLFHENPATLLPQKIEDIEKLTLRWIFSAFVTYASEARKIFALSPDDVQDISEDITLETFGRFVGYPAEARVWSKVDFKRSQWVCLPDNLVRQALLVDTKAEKGAVSNARLQIGQTSMQIRQINGSGDPIEERGALPECMNLEGKLYLTTTILIAYHYADEIDPIYRNVEDVTRIPNNRILKEIIFSAIPNGLLQEKYNPSIDDGIWNVGPHSPARGEEFRTRLSFSKLKRKAPWRVQKISWPNPSCASISARWSD